jgi:hypothetical protein
MAQSAPHDERREPQRRVERPRASRSTPEPASIRGKPLTDEVIGQLGNGGPWDSDQDFEEFIDKVAHARS